MGKENSKFYVEALGELRKIAHKITQSNPGSLPDTKEGLIREADGLALAIQRDVQFLQLHLDEYAEVSMDHLQSELIQLSEDCNLFLLTDKKVPIEPDHRSYLIIILDLINNLIDHFKTHYSYCFNFKKIVPIRYKQKSDLILSKIWEKLIQSLKVAGFDEKLIEVLRLYYLEMKSNKEISFHLLDFWSVLTSDLYKISLEDLDELEVELCRLFCYNNFNYPPIIQYYISKLQLDYDVVDNYRRNTSGLPSR